MSPELFPDLKSIKTFVKDMKMYFSSLSARGAKYIYLNIPQFENSLIISNADYELILSSNPINLSLHIVEFKDSLFLQQFRIFVDLPTDKPYMVRIGPFLKIIKNNNFDDLKMIYSPTLEMQIAINQEIVFSELESNNDFVDTEDEEDESESESDIEEVEEEKEQVETIITFTDESICGQTIENEHALHSLLELLLSTKNKKQEVLDSGYLYSYPKLDLPVTYFLSNYFKINFPLYELSEHRYSDIVLIMIDGLDLPSTKEFFKKRDPNNLQILTWLSSTGHVQHMVHYEDSEIRLYSHRPYAYLYPFKHTTEKGETSNDTKIR